MELNQGILFEILHGLRFSVLFGLTILFGQYIVANKLALRDIRWNMDNIQAAVAFFVYCLGESSWRFLVWINHGDDPLNSHPSAFDFYMPFVLSGVVSLIGALWCLRVLLPERWSWPTWVAMVLVSAVIILLSFVM